ncbi:MAG TPA: hypothetical protein VIX89_02780, partial [Bryobacteraceae bacterium]
SARAAGVTGRSDGGASPRLVSFTGTEVVEAVKKSRTQEHEEHQTSSGKWNDFEERRKPLDTSPVSGVP